MKDILMLHGALAAKTQFDPLRKLIKSDLKAHAINFSGHGGALMSPLGYTFPVFAADILRYIDEHGIRKVNLFGYSMGGYAALYFAKLHPDRVEKIFTLNVKFTWDASSTQKEVAMLNAENLLLKVPSFANNLMLLHGMEMWKSVLQSTSDMMTNLTKQHFLTDEDYAKMDLPVLLAVGDKDLTSGIEQTVEIYRKLPGGRMLVLPDTPHPFEKIRLDELAPHFNHFFGA